MRFSSVLDLIMHLLISMVVSFLAIIHLKGSDLGDYGQGAMS